MNFSFLLRLAATRMRSRACDASARPCVRDVLCGIAFPSVPALRSTCSAAGMPVLFAGFTATSAEFDFSRPFIVGYGSSPSRRDPATQAPRMGERSPGSRTKSFRTCQSLRPRRAVGTLALSRSAMSPSVGIKTSAPGIMTFAAQWLAYALPCRRFACALASANARLGADVDRYSFIASDLHRLLLAGLPAHNPLSSTRKSAQTDVTSQGQRGAHTASLMSRSTLWRAFLEKVTAAMTKS